MRGDFVGRKESSTDLSARVGFHRLGLVAVVQVRVQHDESLGDVFLEIVKFENSGFLVSAVAAKKFDLFEMNEKLEWRNLNKSFFE